MHALVLLGGQGTRLRPLTYDIPKPMLPVVERPMIYQIVEWLARHGVTTVVFALGYQSASFVDAFAGGHHAGVRVLTAVEPEPRDTAGAIAFAADFAGVAGERLIVVNGDILTDLDLGAVVAFHERSAAAATIALTPVADPSAFGVVPTDDDGKVVEFIEKPAPGTAPTNMINAGTYVLEPSVIDRIPRGVPVSIERQIFPEVAASRELYAVASEAYWLDTGTPDRYRRAQHDVLSGLRPHVRIPPHEVVAPGVLVADGAAVAGETRGLNFFAERSAIEQAAIVDGCVIGAGATVAAGARLRHCVVLAGATIEPHSHLERCIVGPGARVGARARLGDTIIGAGYDVADEAHVENGRLPE